MDRLATFLSVVAVGLGAYAVAAARGGDAEARVLVYQGTDACVGERVAAALRHHGLTVLWEGDPAERIGVSITDWRKPLPV